MGTPAELRQEQIDAAGESVQAVVLRVGNPQCVVLGPLPDDNRFRRLGAALEQHEMFAGGTNVEFAHVETPSRIRILIWERGVGPTLSSGTGACASAVAACINELTDRRVTVEIEAGRLEAEWRDDGEVLLTGGAEVVYRGEWLKGV